jgi:hypothetical protein
MRVWRDREPGRRERRDEVVSSTPWGSRDWVCRENHEQNTARTLLVASMPLTIARLDGE